MLLASLMSCSTPQPFPEVCERVEVPLEPDAQSTFGFSGMEALELFQTERNQWEVTWSGDTEPSVDTFVVETGVLVGTNEVNFVAIDEESADFCPSPVLLVETTFELHAADGGIEGTGPATLQMQSLIDNPVAMFFEWDDVVLSETRESEVAALIASDRPDAKVDTVALEANGTALGLTAWWSEADGTHGSSAPFQCSWNLYDCMTMSAVAEP